MGVAHVVLYVVLINKIEFVQNIWSRDRIQVRPGYFLKRMRPTWPVQNVTRVTRIMRMTRPTSNADHNAIGFTACGARSEINGGKWLSSKHVITA